VLKSGDFVSEKVKSRCCHVLVRILFCSTALQEALLTLILVRASEFPEF